MPSVKLPLCSKAPAVRSMVSVALVKVMEPAAVVGKFSELRLVTPVGTEATAPVTVIFKLPVPTGVYPKKVLVRLAS